MLHSTCTNVRISLMAMHQLYQLFKSIFDVGIGDHNGHGRLLIGIEQTGNGGYKLERLPSFGRMIEKEGSDGAELELLIGGNASQTIT